MPPSRNLGVGNAGCGGRHDGGFLRRAAPPISSAPRPSRRRWTPSEDPLRLIVAAGARKEKLREREFRHVPRARPRYAELRVASAFSFLDGASLPEDLVEQAARCEIPAVALVDRN